MYIDPQAADSISKALNTEPAKNLLSPLSKEIGELLGEVANLARFYANDNLQKIFTKWALSRRAGHIIDATDFQKVMPLLPMAAMQSDDELQDKWATLLEAAAVGKHGYIVSFGQTLSQITPESGRFLDTVFYDWLRRSERSPEFSSDRELNYYLLEIYDPELHDYIAPRKGKPDEIGISIEDAQRWWNADLGIRDLERIGLLIRHIGYDMDVNDPDELEPNGVDPCFVTFTKYGESFMRTIGKRR